MENFTNETLNTNKLPDFEQVVFSKLFPTYWSVILINRIILFLIVGGGLIFVSFRVPEIVENKIILSIGFFVFCVLTLAISRISFIKKGFAFREHDVLFTFGILATSTVVIPYNRIQHVALEEGIVSRFYGLSTLAIFTAGGSNSDIQIPGIKKGEAEKIKQLLMGKIQIQLQ